VEPSRGGSTRKNGGGHLHVGGTVTISDSQRPRGEAKVPVELLLVARRTRAVWLWSRRRRELWKYRRSTEGGFGRNASTKDLTKEA